MTPELRPWIVTGLLVAGLPAVTDADLLVVLNKSDHDAALVDPATLAVVGKLPTGRGPHEAVTSPDGSRAYVANYGAYALFRDGEQPKLERGSSITVLDLVRRAVVDTFDLGEYESPHGIALSKDGTLLWVTCEASQAVLELDARTGAIQNAWKTGQEVSHMLAPTPDERKLYVANIRSGTATVIERAAGTVRSIATGAGAEGIAVRPDGREAWVTNRSANTISILATDSDSVVATLEAGGEMPIRVQFTPDGREAWVSCARSNRINVFDVRKRERIAAVEVGAMPIGIQMSPRGDRAFVANTNDNKVTVIDVRARKVLGTFATGTEPDGMAWARGARAAAPKPKAATR